MVSGLFTISRLVSCLSISRTDDRQPRPFSLMLAAGSTLPLWSAERPSPTYVGGTSCLCRQRQALASLFLLSRSVDRKAEARAVTLPTLAVRCSPDPCSRGQGVRAILPPTPYPLHPIPYTLREGPGVRSYPQKGRLSAWAGRSPLTTTNVAATFSMAQTKSRQTMETVCLPRVSVPLQGERREPYRAWATLRFRCGGAAAWPSERTPRCCASSVARKKPMHISSVVCSPQNTSLGGCEG